MAPIRTPTVAPYVAPSALAQLAAAFSPSKMVENYQGEQETIRRRGIEDERLARERDRASFEEMLRPLERISAAHAAEREILPAQVFAPTQVEPITSPELGPRAGRSMAHMGELGPERQSLAGQLGPPLRVGGTPAALRQRSQARMAEVPQGLMPDLSIGQPSAPPEFLPEEMVRYEPRTEMERREREAREQAAADAIANDPKAVKELGIPKVLVRHLSPAQLTSMLRVRRYRPSDLGARVNGVRAIITNLEDQLENDVLSAEDTALLRKHLRIARDQMANLVRLGDFTPSGGGEDDLGDEEYDAFVSAIDRARDGR